MNFELDKSVCLAVDGARLKVLTDFVMDLAHVPATDLINGGTLQGMACSALEKSIEAGRQAYFHGSMG